MLEPLLPEIRAALLRMLPAGVVASAGAVDGAVTPLGPAELPATMRMSPLRLKEFAAGRAQARAALGQLGLHAPEVAVLPDRRPLWPAGFVGSISHAGPLALAVAAPATALQAIGIDVEPAVPLDEELVQRICRPEELARLATSPAPLKLAKLIFSAKESVYKCIAPLTGIFLEFEDVEILFEDGEPRFGTRGHGPAMALLGPATLTGAFAEAGGYWITVAWQLPPATPGQE